MQSAKTGSLRDLVLLTFEYPPMVGGIARLCAEVVGILQRTRSRIYVLTQECSGSIPPSSLTQVRVVAQRPRREWRAFRWLRRNSFPSGSPCPLTICGIWYPEGLIACLAGIRPLVILAHGAELLAPIGRGRRWLWRSLQRHVLQCAQVVIANSEYTGALVKKSAPKANVKVIPLAVDATRFTPGNRETAKSNFQVTGKRVLCTVSRLEQYKAHDTVLHAIANLAPEEREKIIYLVAGTGPHKEYLLRQASVLGIASHVRWLGFVPDEDLPELYRASDLFVLCTREAVDKRSVEGFGLVFLEAQSCGTPVVGTRTGGIPSAIRHGHGGWLIDQNDSEELCKIIRLLIYEPHTCREAGALARQRILQECTWEHYGHHLSLTLRDAGLICE